MIHQILCVGQRGRLLPTRHNLILVGAVLEVFVRSSGVLPEDELENHIKQIVLVFQENPQGQGHI